MRWTDFGKSLVLFKGFFLGNACYVLEGFSEASLVPRAANLSRATSIFDWTFSMLAITLPTFSMASQITTGEIEYWLYGTNLGMFGSSRMNVICINMDPCLKGMFLFNISLWGNLQLCLWRCRIILHILQVGHLVRIITWIVGSGVNRCQPQVETIGNPFPQSFLREGFLILILEASRCLDINPVLLQVSLVFVSPATQG